MQSEVQKEIKAGLKKGLSTREIGEALNAKNITTPRGLKWSTANTNMQIQALKKKSKGKSPEKATLEVYSGKTVSKRKSKRVMAEAPAGIVTLIMGSVVDVGAIMRGLK